MTRTLHHKERTDPTEFEILEGPGENDDDTRLFLRIFTGKGGTHLMFELTDDELTKLHTAVNDAPRPIQ